MTQIEKLYAQLIANRTTMRFRDFPRILEAFRFMLDRINGSHHIFKYPAVPMRSASSRAETMQSPINQQLGSS